MLLWGGYTHANWLYTDEIVENVDSWDFTSSYPYVLVAYKFPMSKFKKCYIKKREQMSKKFAYLLKVKFKNVKCKYFNNFISMSKCIDIENGRYDNGRLISADCFEMFLTDVDFYFILDSYQCEYEIEEIFYSIYNFLPKIFIEFILDKYVDKTKLKNVEGKEIDYAKIKNRFNSLYGMCVTNNIRDEVIFDNISGWQERELTNEEIQNALDSEIKKPFLNFAWGVWCTAHARNNLLRTVIQLDRKTIYCDTDSIKLLQGYDKNVITKYNESVKKRIEFSSLINEIPIEKFEPKDIKGTKRLLGVFDDDGHYLNFITQGAKKYAVIKEVKNEKIKKDSNIIESGPEKSKILEITVAGVPKKGSKALKSIDDFRDDFVFKFEYTNKNLLFYTEEQQTIEMTDFQGNKYIVNDKSGCCLLPTTYVLGKSEEYCELISDDSSKRAIYRE